MMAAVHGQFGVGLASISSSYGGEDDDDDDETIRPSPPPSPSSKPPCKSVKYSTRIVSIQFGTQNAIALDKDPVVFDSTAFEFSVTFPPNFHAHAKSGSGVTTLRINVTKMKEIKYVLNTDVCLIAILLNGEKSAKGGKSPGEALRNVMHNDSVDASLAAKRPSDVKYFEPTSNCECQRWILIRLDCRHHLLHRRHFDDILEAIRMGGDVNDGHLSNKQKRDARASARIQTTVMSGKEAIGMMRAAGMLPPAKTINQSRPINQSNVNRSRMPVNNAVHVNPRMINRAHINPNHPNFSAHSNDAPNALTRSAPPKTVKGASLLGATHRTNTLMGGGSRNAAFRVTVPNAPTSLGTVILSNLSTRPMQAKEPTQVSLIDDGDEGTASTSQRQMQPQAEKGEFVDRTREWKPNYKDDAVSLKGYYVESSPTPTSSSTCATSSLPESVADESHAVVVRLAPDTLLFKSGVGEMLLCDLAKLEETREINDNCVDFYMHHIKTVISVVDKDSLHFYNTFFYSKFANEPTLAETKRVNLKSVPSGAREFLASINVKGETEQKNAIARYNRVKTWTKKANIFEKHALIIPIHEGVENHWYIAIAFFPCRTTEPRKEQPSILVLDSLGIEPARHTVVASHIRLYLGLEFAHKRANLPKSIIPFTIRHFPLILPQLSVQENDYDCGIMMLMYVQRLLSIPLLETYSKARVQELLTMEVHKEVARKRLELIQLVIQCSVDAGGPKIIRAKEPPRHCKQDQTTGECSFSDAHATPDAPALPAVENGTGGEEQKENQQRAESTEESKVETNGAQENDLPPQLCSESLTDISPRSTPVVGGDSPLKNNSPNGDENGSPPSKEISSPPTKDKPPVEQTPSGEDESETPIAESPLPIPPTAVTDVPSTAKSSKSPKDSVKTPRGKQSRKRAAGKSSAVDVGETSMAKETAPDDHDDYRGEESHTSRECLPDDSMTQTESRPMPTMEPENQGANTAAGDATMAAPKPPRIKSPSQLPPVASRHKTRSSTGSIPPKRARIEF